MYFILRLESYKSAVALLTVTAAWQFRLSLRTLRTLGLGHF